METGPENRLRGKRIGVTAGPTRAWIDPVRYLANASSGQLGILIALALAEKGAFVDLVVGPGVDPPAKAGVRVHSIVTVEDLTDCLTALSQETRDPFSIWVHAMAVLDYVPEEVSATKIPSGNSNMALRLKPSPKVIGEFRNWFPKSLLVGFKLETTEDLSELRRSAAHLGERYHCDLVVANHAPFRKPDEHTAYFLVGDDSDWLGPFRGKETIAQELVNRLASNRGFHVPA